jgi:hypothetical protein
MLLISHASRHTSHVTRHTSHVTHHTPHVTRFAQAPPISSWTTCGSTRTRRQRRHSGRACQCSPHPTSHWHHASRHLYFKPQIFPSSSLGTPTTTSTLCAPSPHAPTSSGRCKASCARHAARCRSSTRVRTPTNSSACCSCSRRRRRRREEGGARALPCTSRSLTPARAAG